MSEVATSEGPYSLGTLVQIEGQFYDDTGVEADPTSITLRIELPDGTEQSFVYGTDTELVRQDVGLYYLLHLSTQEGLHAWAMEGDGAVQYTIEGSFRVKAILTTGLIRRALCTLDDVLGFAPGYEDDQATNEKLVELINEQTREAYAFTGKEFIAIEALQPATRLYDVDHSDYLARTFPVQIKQEAGLTVKVLDLNSDVIHEVPAASCILLPRVREEFAPFEELWLPSQVTEPAMLAPGRVVSIEASWGWPEVPSDLRQAVARLTIESYLTSVSEQGTKFASAVNGGDNNFDREASLDTAMKALRRYRDWSVG